MQWKAILISTLTTIKHNIKKLQTQGWRSLKMKCFSFLFFHDFMLHVKENYLCMSQKNLQASVKLSGYLQRKKGDSFSYQLYGLFNATKSGKYPWIYNAFRTRVSRQTKKSGLYLEVSVWKRNCSTRNRKSPRKSRNKPCKNIALISHMRYF